MLSPTGIKNTASFSTINPNNAGIHKYMNSGLLKNEEWIALKPEQREKLRSALLDEDVQKYIDNRYLDIHTVICNLDEFCDINFKPASSMAANMLSIIKNKNIQKYIDNGSLTIFTAIHLTWPTIKLLNSRIIQEKIDQGFLDIHKVIRFEWEDTIRTSYFSRL